MCEMHFLLASATAAAVAAVRQDFSKHANPTCEPLRGCECWENKAGAGGFPACSGTSRSQKTPFIWNRAAFASPFLRYLVSLLPTRVFFSPEGLPMSRETSQQPHRPGAPRLEEGGAGRVSHGPGVQLVLLELLRH